MVRHLPWLLVAALSISACGKQREAEHPSPGGGYGPGAGPAPTTGPQGGPSGEVRKRPDGTCVRYQHPQCPPGGTCDPSVPEPVPCPPGL